MTAVYPVLATVAAYLLGSLSFAVIVTRVMGLSDPRTYGSKNPGATNVLRSGSKAAAIVTLLLDAMKGWLPVALVMWFGHPYGLEDGTVALVGLAAFLGHLWPVFFRFQGGKGVATALGVLVGISGWLGLATAATWLIIAFFFRYSSLASLVASLLDKTGNHRSQPSLYQTASGKPRIQSALARSAVSLELNHRTMVRLGLYAAQHSAGLRGLVTAPGAL